MRRRVLAAGLAFFAVLALAVSAWAQAPAVDPRTGNNVCKLSKKALSDGTQNRDGQCVETILGEVPDVTRMASTLILFPQDGDVIKENTPFTIRTKTVNLQTGFFSDPQKEYYLFPQTLDERSGLIQGHSQVVVQQIQDPNQPLDPQVFALFKALNDPADGDGELNALVENGLKAGRYRLCAEPVSFSHMPVIRPVEQAGVAGDCIRFTVEPK